MHRRAGISIQDLAEMDLETFEWLHGQTCKEEARQQLSQYSTSAVAFCGDKKSSRKFVQDLSKIANGGSSSPPPNSLGASDFLRKYGNSL